MNLYVQDSNGFSPASKETIVKAALGLTARSIVRSDALNNPRAVREYLQVRFADLQHEVFTIIYLDNRNRVLKVEEMFRGTIDGASVHPREVVKGALLNNAAAVIFAHNHPSGVGDPSQADEIITARLKDALALIDVRVLDHLIVAGPFVTSFAERGLL